MEGTMQIKTYHIDAFTQEPFKGNPAAVCLIPYEFVHDREEERSSSVVTSTSSASGERNDWLTGNTVLSSINHTNPLPIEKVFAAIAAEFNLSETAFIIPLERSTRNGNEGKDKSADPFIQNNSFQLRWFTPTTEVNLCGHATLASSQALYNYGNRHSEFLFHTLSGILKVTKDTPLTVSSSSSSIPSSSTLPLSPSVSNPRWAMRFPFNPPILRPWSTDSILKNELLPHCLRLPSSVLADPVISSLLSSSSSSLASFFTACAAAKTNSLPASSSYILPNDELLSILLHSVHYNVRTKKLIIRLQDTYTVLLSYFQPDTFAMLKIDQSSYSLQQRITGVSITVKADQSNKISNLSSSSTSIDFLSRYFSPWNGIPEDPVNGSSHTILGPFWCNVLQRYGNYTNIIDLSSLPDNDASISKDTYRQRTGEVIGYQQSKRTGILYLKVCERTKDSSDNQPVAIPSEYTEYISNDTADESRKQIMKIEDTYSYVELGGYAVTIGSGYLHI